MTIERETDKQIATRVLSDVGKHTFAFIVADLAKRLLAADAKLNEPVDAETWFEQAWVMAFKDHVNRCRSKEDARFWFLGGAAMRARVSEDTALLDWADRVGHYDALYDSARDELRAAMAASPKPDQDSVSRDTKE